MAARENTDLRGLGDLGGLMRWVSLNQKVVKRMDVSEKKAAVSATAR
jgi:hypothetical protein